mmetsp:Transcript_12645/g.23737  ORF Transcript_12645/g.23737 Transcript_12645/m.23737 type:complete len:87 (-) Transcript_12645:85-345(-)
MFTCPIFIDCKNEVIVFDCPPSHEKRQFRDRNRVENSLSYKWSGLSSVESARSFAPMETAGARSVTKMQMNISSFLPIIRSAALSF